MIQKRMGAEYTAEVPLKFTEVTERSLLVVEGRADGILEQSGEVTIDEIKGTYRDLARMREPVPVHLAQAKCYAYMYGLQRDCKEIRVRMTCHDRMVKFEKDMPTAEQRGISYPVTVRTLFERLCNYFEVPYRTSSFANSGATVNDSDNFRSSTARTVLGWIAEAAGSNARFDRDGYLVMYWIHPTGISVNESGYTEFLPYWYETPKVNKLYNRDTSVGEDIIYGSGNNGYLIQNNPLLRGVS